MTKFARLVQEVKKSRGIEEFIAVGTEEARQVQPLAAAIANEWYREMTVNYKAHNVTPKEAEFATMTFNAWLRDRALDRPLVLAAPPAFGKSAMLSMYLRMMTCNFPDTFGAVVVKERLEDLEQLQREINESCGTERAFLIRGYSNEKDDDGNVMSRLEYSEQFHKQREYNVLLMTTKQLERQAMRDNLEAFTSFEADDKRLQRRSLLLIDEKPSLVLSHTLSVRNLNDFMSDVSEISRDVRGKVKPYYNRVRQVVDNLRNVLEDTYTPIGEFRPIDQRFKMPAQLVKDFADNYTHDEMATLRAVERTINAGGEYSVYNGVGIVTSTHVVHYKYTIFNTYILDGTGKRDPEYMSDDFYVVQPENLLDYSNVTFRVCNSYNLSKTALKQSAESLENIITMTKRIIAEHKDEKTLVVTYKENLAEIKEALKDEIESGQAKIKHFDGGRGSNDYVDCNSAIYIGTLFKGTSYYATAAQAVIGDKIGEELERGYSSTPAGLTFNDEYTEQYKKTDIAINLIQETNRLRAGRKPDYITIYLFNRDEEMIDIILNEYPEAKCEEYEPLERLTGKPEAIDEVINFFANMQKGEKVKQSTIYRELDMHRNTFGKLAKMLKFKEAMEKYGITKEKTSYIKK